jgi:hypothetical protein
MDSSLSDLGRARRIIYAWGNRDVAAPNTLLASLGRSEIFLKIESLRDAYVDGIAAYIKIVESDPGLTALVRGRARKFFMDQSSFP